jgi:hypothetical protein
MKTQTIETYDWMEDVEPELLKNLNELLAKKGIDPMEQLHGGAFLDGKWVSVSESNDYRNYWHAYLEVWGEKLHNDSYQTVWFNDPDDDEEWRWYKEHLREWSSKPTNGYKHTDPNWTDDLVDAMRKVVKEHLPYDKRTVFWWSW